MKITKSKLKEIIKEELKSVVSETAGEEQKDPHRDALRAINSVFFMIEQLKSHNKFPQSLKEYHGILDSLETAANYWLQPRTEEE